MSELSLEERGAKCSKEIAVILKKYNMGLAVNIEGAQGFINSLQPTLIDASKTNITNTLKENPEIEDEEEKND